MWVDTDSYRLRAGSSSSSSFQLHAATKSTLTSLSFWFTRYTRFSSTFCWIYPFSSCGGAPKTLASGPLASDLRRRTSRLRRWTTPTSPQRALTPPQMCRTALLMV